MPPCTHTGTLYSTLGTPLHPCTGPAAARVLAWPRLRRGRVAVGLTILGGQPESLAAPCQIAVTTVFYTGLRPGPEI